MIHEPKKLTEAIEIILIAVKKLHLNDDCNNTWSISWTDCLTDENNNG